MTTPKRQRGDITLRDHMDLRFEALEKAMEARFAALEKSTAAALAAADRAVAKAETAADKRFESVNEFRAALSDSSRLTMPRAEAEQVFAAIGEKIESLTVRANARDDRGQGVNQVWVFLAAAVAVLASIYGLFK